MCVPQMTEDGGQLEALIEGYNCIIIDEAHEGVLESEKSHVDRSFGVYLEDYLPDGDNYYDHSYKWVDCKRHLGSMPRMTPKTLICSATLPRAISDKLDVSTMRICLKVDNPNDNFRKAEKGSTWTVT